MRPALLDRLCDYFQVSRSDAHRVLHGLVALDRQFLLRSEILDAYATCAAEAEGPVDSPLAEAIGHCQEGAPSTTSGYTWPCVSVRRAGNTGACTWRP